MISSPPLTVPSTGNTSTIQPLDGSRALVTKGKVKEERAHAGIADKVEISGKEDPVARDARKFKKAGAIQKDCLMASLAPAYDMDEKSLAEKSRFLKDMVIFTNPELEGFNHARILADIEKNLSGLPLSFFTLLADFRVKIVPVRRGQSLVGTPLATEIKTLSAFQDRDALQRARDVLSSEGVKALRENYARLRKQNAGRGEEYLSDLDYKETSGINERLPAEFSFLKAHRSQTLEEIALLRYGIRGKKDMKEFCALMCALNSELAPAKDMLKTPVEEGAELLIPNITYQYSRGARETAARKFLADREMSDEIGDHLALKDSTNGFYHFKSRTLAVMLDVLPDPALDPSIGHYRTIVHEFGHALHKALACRAQEEGTSFAEKVETMYEKRYRRAGKDKKAFITDYSARSPEEFFADGFEAFFTCSLRDGCESYKKELNHQNLKKSEAGLFSLIEELAGKKVLRNRNKVNSEN